MATVILLGTDSTDYTGGDGANLICWTKWQAIDTGKVTEIKIYCGGSGYVKVALYSHNSGTNKPDSLPFSSVTRT